MLANGWLVILIATILSAGAVGYAAHLRKPVYAASVQLFAVVPGDAGVTAAYQGDRGAAVRIDTYTQLAKSALVTRRTIDDVGLAITPAQLAKQIAAAPIPGTLSQFSTPMSALLRVQVKGDNPATTVDTANALAKNLIAASREVEWTDSGPGAELVLIDSARSAQHAGRSLLMTLAIGAGIGLVLSCFLVLAYGIARGRVLDRRQVDRVVAQTVSGKVPWDVR